MPHASSNVQPEPRPRWRKLLAGALVLVVVVAAALALGLYAAHRYLASERPKVFDEVALLNGGSVSFGPLRGLDYADYPDLTLRVGDVYVGEGPEGRDDTELLHVGEAELRVTLDVWADTVATLHAVTLRDARLALESDSAGVTNLRRLLGAGEASSPQPRKPSRFEDRDVVLADDFALRLLRTHLAWRRPDHGAHIAARIDSAVVRDVRLDAGFAARLQLATHVEQLQLKGTEGAYLCDGRVDGSFGLAVRDGILTATAPGALVGGNEIDLDVRYALDRSEVSRLGFGMPRTVLAKARPLLTPGLRDAIALYDVEGAFASETRLYLPTERGVPAYVEIDVALRGNDARVERERFGDVYADGTFVNRLPGVDTFGPGLRRGVRFEIDTARADYYGFDVRSGGGLVTAALGGPTYLDAAVHARGPSRAASDALATEQFAFEGGSAEVRGRVRGPVDDINALIDASDGDIRFDDMTVHMRAAGVRLPLDSLVAHKLGGSADVAVAGRLPTPGHHYALTGRIDGMGRLLYGGYGQPTRTSVALTAPHVSWRDIVRLLSAEAAPTAPHLTAIDTTARATDDETTAEQVANMKAAFAQLQATFDPTLQLAIDTLGYYGVEVFDARSGVHFVGDRTVVLEETTFRVDTATVRFGASLNIGEARRTPFRYELHADHLDVDALMPELGYLGQRFLREIETYPNDVTLDAVQEGYIDDEQGLLTNSSTGSITLVSNQLKAFEASVTFEPDDPLQPEKKGTHVSLRGSPSLFNDFFRTEDFFFRDGTFEFEMSYSGLVPDLRTLVDQERMSLRIDGANVLFATAGLVVPLTSLALDVDRDNAGLELLLVNDDLGQELQVYGTAINVSEVVLGQTGKQFSTDVTVTSPRLVWADLNELIGEFGDDAPRDTAQDLNIRANLRAIMREFEPDVRLEIGELVLSRFVSLRNVSSGLRMDGRDLLTVDTTSFEFQDGEMELAGTLDLRDLKLTPFEGYLATERLDLAALLRGFDYFGMPSLRQAERLEGVLSMRAEGTGAILGGEASGLLTDASRGTLEFELRDLALEGIGLIDSLAAKLRARRRLDSLAFAPLTNRLELHGDSLYVPVMEVQSNGFNVFVEGSQVLGGAPDLWVSVPLYNLKRRDLSVVPDKRGWRDSRFKVHFALRGAGNKLKLSKRGYYRRAGRLDDWRRLRGKRVRGGDSGEAGAGGD